MLPMDLMIYKIQYGVILAVMCLKYGASHETRSHNRKLVEKFDDSPYVSLDRKTSDKRDNSSGKSNNRQGIERLEHDIKTKFVLAVNEMSRTLVSGNQRINQMQYPEHPLRPMRTGTGNSFGFRINKLRHPKCGLKQDFYTVVKDEATHGGIFTVDFRASIDGAPVAASTCSPGWIHNVDVDDGGRMEHGINARDCGISTVLTELCLMDPELNYLYHLSRPNRALEFLYNYPTQFGHVQDYCNGLMGMAMEAKPPTGAYAYFSAALRTGYRRMLVLANDKFYYFWVETAKRRYDVQSEWSSTIGLIEECCCEACSCDAWGKIWLFCKDM